MAKEKAIPLNQKAYSVIKKSIITMDLPPGSQIDESYLMRMFSIGRTPIREALFRLAAEELVETAGNRGFFVTPITLEDVRSLFEAMLISIRSHAVLAARGVQKEHLERLYKAHQAHQEAITKRDFFEITLLNSRFHRIICEATNNRYLIYSFNHLQDQAQRLSYLSYSKEIPPYDINENFKIVIETHASIISLLEKKDATGLLERLLEHSEQFRSRVLCYLNPSTETITKERSSPPSLKDG